MTNSADLPSPDRLSAASQPAPPRRCGIWESILQLAYVFWIVRVPLITTSLGFLILIGAPQAQDLFVEFSTPSSWPAFLKEIENPGLLVELALSPIWRMLLLLLVLTIFWAMPTHYAARLLLDTDARFRQFATAQREPAQKTCLEAMERCVPRFLGTMTYVAMLCGIARSFHNVPILQETSVTDTVEFWLYVLAALVFAAGVGFFIYMIKRPDHTDLPILRTLRRLNQRIAPFWRAVWPGLREQRDSQDEADRNVGRFLFVSLCVVFVVIFAFGADFAAWLFPRAMAVPFILGGWLPFLSYVSAAGRQVRGPLIVGLFVAVAALAVVLGDNHMVRRIDAGHSVDLAQMPLEAAVKLWMTENKCKDVPASCPRPIIIAASGGASRAGFFTSSVIGYFMQEAPKHGLTANDIRNRLFAISSVSGSSMGAVMVTAALDAKADSTDHPCVQSPYPLWWGITIRNWRDCFEALTSGDFLTAVFFGFAFNDMFPFAWRDRAGVLEDAWSDRFEGIVTRPDRAKDPPSCKGLRCPFFTLRPRPGHWIPVLVLNGTSEITGGRVVTTPLAAHYKPGASGCTTSTDPAGCKLFSQTSNFHDLLKYEYHPDAKPGSWLGGIERLLLRFLHRNDTLDDVQLSTAAHNSARFPLISPAGTVRNQDQQIVDRIVDGGYFENYGALSATELVLAIHAVQPELVPLLLVISNDPDDLLDPSSDSDESDKAAELRKQYETRVGAARAEASGSEAVTDVTATIKTFVKAWTGHGTLAVERLRSSLHQTYPGCPVQVIPVRVWPQPPTAVHSRAVSMSWWLSTPIQRHLHQQTEEEKNGNQNEPRLKAAWSLMTAAPSCPAASQPR